MHLLSHVAARYPMPSTMQLAQSVLQVTPAAPLSTVDRADPALFFSVYAALRPHRRLATAAAPAGAASRRPAIGICFGLCALAAERRLAERPSCRRPGLRACSLRWRATLSTS